MSNLIRSTVFLRSTDWSLLKFDCYDKGRAKQYEDDLEILIKQIQNTNPRADERNKMQTGNGNWAYKLDDNKVCYLVLTSNDYPERQVYAMIKEMEKELKKLVNYQNLTPKEVSKFVNNFIKDLQDKYNNLQGIDKIQQAQAQIDEVKLVMEDNVKRMLVNTEQIDQLDQRAGEMKMKSKQFAQQSTDLARIMYCRNMKLKIAIGIIVISVLLYIAVPLIISATAVGKAVGKDITSEFSGSSSAASTTSSPTNKSSTSGLGTFEPAPVVNSPSTTTTSTTPTTTAQSTTTPTQSTTSTTTTQSATPTTTSTAPQGSTNGTRILLEG